MLSESTEKAYLIQMKIAIVTNVMPSYREGFYTRLFAREDLRVTVFCQESLPGVNLRTIHHRFGERVALVSHLSLSRERLVWQRLPWKRLLAEYDVIFVMGNPRVLSDVALGTFLVLRRKAVVLWTMAHAASSNPLTERLRLLWSRIFGHIFVYTDSEVSWLRSRGFARQHIVGMNNGLDQKRIDEAASQWSVAELADWRRMQLLEGERVVLSCARLEKKNRFDLMVEALPEVLKQIPNLVWVVVGGGAEERGLRDKVRAAGLDGRVRFVGELYEERSLAAWFLSAELLVHPGAIGLSLLHSFGYGLPVVTHSNSEHHYPEFAAFEAGETGCTFTEGLSSDLAGAIVRMLTEPAALVRMGRRARECARDRYNVDVMVERFVALARSAAETSKGSAIAITR